MLYRLFDILVNLDPMIRDKVLFRSKTDAVYYCAHHYATVDAYKVADAAFLYFVCRRVRNMVKSPNGPVHEKSDVLDALYERLASDMKYELKDYFAHIHDHYANQFSRSNKPCLQNLKCTENTRPEK